MLLKCLKEKIEKVTKQIYEKFKVSVPKIFDKAAEELHNSQNECYACDEKFSSEERGLMKVREHCHYTGKYRGALHSKCNLRLRRSKTIPVFANNLTGYDGHLLITRLSDTLGKVRCIPNNEERYKSISRSVLVDIIVKNDKEV